MEVSDRYLVCSEHYDNEDNMKLGFENGDEENDSTTNNIDAAVTTTIYIHKLSSVLNMHVTSVSD